MGFIVSRLVPVVCKASVADARRYFLHIEDLGAHSKHQRRGIAQRLLDAVKQIARTLDVPMIPTKELVRIDGSVVVAAVTLTTMRDVPFSRSFYEKCGFCVVENAKEIEGNLVLKRSRSGRATWSGFQSREIKVSPDGDVGWRGNSIRSPNLEGVMEPRLTSCSLFIGQRLPTNLQDLFLIYNRGFAIKSTTLSSQTSSNRSTRNDVCILSPEIFELSPTDPPCYVGYPSDYCFGGSRLLPSARNNSRSQNDGVSKVES